MFCTEDLANMGLSDIKVWMSKGEGAWLAWPLCADGGGNSGNSYEAMLHQERKTISMVDEWFAKYGEDMCNSFTAQYPCFCFADGRIKERSSFWEGHHGSTVCEGIFFE